MMNTILKEYTISQNYITNVHLLLIKDTITLTVVSFERI